VIGEVVRLTSGMEEAVERRLRDDVDVNLFLLGFSRLHPIDRAHWYGIVDGSEIRALALVVPQRLVVPWCPDPRDGRAIGKHLRDRFEPCMLVGPRDACDALWDGWTQGRVPFDRRYDQRLYVLRNRPTGPTLPGFRTARLSEWPIVARSAGLMEEEDLGRNPHSDNPSLHERVVRERVRSGRTWVTERDGQIVFQINVGTVLPEGAQIGGTWVPPKFRRQGHAIDGVRALCQRLFDDHPVVTLHVNEANLPAVRTYEHVGFERTAAFRLLTV